MTVKRNQQKYPTRMIVGSSCVLHKPLIVPSVCAVISFHLSMYTPPPFRSRVCLV
ncbi:hypothetical protein XELAEV_18041969mg [Xenopus laevis]|uniref:Uncharacterized protein n=1 Tax=Xenopus laevis TaxID=8355 RepID=A0A974C303_XENLA|nr:hypothetical protein XELAEV_18041969mg [Xenopus laevis]